MVGHQDKIQPQGRIQRKQSKDKIYETPWIHPYHAGADGKREKDGDKNQYDHSLSNITAVLLPDNPWELTTETFASMRRGLADKLSGQFGSRVSQLTVGGSKPRDRLSAALAT